MRPVEACVRQPRAGSVFRPSDNCWTVARADRVAFLIDGEAYFRAFIKAAERARHSILILAWDFSSGARLHFDADDKPGGHAPPDRLGEFLNWLARRRPELHIRILDWDYPMLFGTDREFPPIYGLGGWTPHHRVQVVYDDQVPVGACHHQKVVVIDDAIAFVGGFDLTDRRWDTCSHDAADPRRCVGEAPYPPFHDLMMMVDGEAARAFGELGRRRWQAATQSPVPPGPPPGATPEDDPWPPEVWPDVSGVEVAIARTEPALPGRPEVREVERLYLDMIAAAREVIYIENQYFTANVVCEALARRLEEPDGPEVVFVLRLLSHGWLEEYTMHVLRTRLIERLFAADRHGRLGLYYAHLDGLCPGTCIDIHSKLIIVDDEMVRIGSANLSNRSMGLDSECDAAIEARGDARVAAAIRSLRHRLLGEHLDVAPEAVEEAAVRLGGINAAIGELRGRARTLRPFESVPEWSDTALDLASIADPERPVSMERLVEEFAPAVDLEQPHRGWRALLPRLAALALALLGLTALWRLTPLAEVLSVQAVIDWAHAFANRPWAPAALLLAYTPAALLLFPRQLITLGAVVAFGAFAGAMYALGGILLAAFVTYGIGRKLPRRTVRSLAGRHINRVSDTLRRRGLLAMTAVRVVPVAPFAVIGLVAGALRVRLRDFMLGTFIGTLPGTFTTIFFGSQIEAALEDPGRINYGLIAAVVAVVLLFSLVIRRWLARQRRKRAHKPAEGQAC